MNGLRAELDNMSVYVDCPQCMHYRPGTSKSPNTGKETLLHYCGKFDQALPEEILELGCGEGDQDIPF